LHNKSNIRVSREKVFHPRRSRLNAEHSEEINLSPFALLMTDTIALTTGNRVRFNIQRVCPLKSFKEGKQHAGRDADCDVPSRARLPLIEAA